MEEVNTKKRLNSFIRHRGYFVRMLLTTLAAGCIPLIIVSVILLYREQRNLNVSEQQQLEYTANLVAEQFDSYVERMNQINNKIQASPEFLQYNLQSSILVELDCIETIANLKISLPFVHDWGIYFAKNIDAVYVPNAKYHVRMYASGELNTNEQRFREMFTPQLYPYFYAWDDLLGYSFYIIPIRVGSSLDVYKYDFFVISHSSLKSSLSTLLANKYGLASISGNDSTPVYRNPDCPFNAEEADESTSSITGSDNQEYLIRSVQSPDGYRIVLYTDKALYQNSLLHINSYVRNIALLSFIICIVFIIMAVLYNYQTINKIFKKVQSSYSADSPRSDELQYIMNAYSDQVEQKNRLQSQLQDQFNTIIANTFENLLNGENVSKQSIKLLKFESPFYFIASCSLSELSNVNTIIKNNSLINNIYAIEMYRDGYLTFICRSDNPSKNTRSAIVDKIRETMNIQVIPLGVSAGYEHIEQLSIAYIEASKSLEYASPGTVAFIDDIKDAGIGLNVDEEVPLAKLTYALKTGDEFAVAYANKMFDQITTGFISLPRKRYACFRLIELFRQACDNTGVSLDLDQVAQITQKNDLTELREGFILLLKEYCESQHNKNQKSFDLTASKVINYINDNYTNSDFGMNSIAEYLGVSVFTASRMLKKMFGINIKKLINEKRIEHAKELLITTERSIADISINLGFFSTSYFIRLFKESVGVTPAIYRMNQHR